MKSKSIPYLLVPFLALLSILVFLGSCGEETGGKLPENKKFLATDADVTHRGDGPPCFSDCPVPVKVVNRWKHEWTKRADSNLFCLFDGESYTTQKRWLNDSTYRKLVGKCPTCTGIRVYPGISNGNGGPSCPGFLLVMVDSTSCLNQYQTPDGDVDSLPFFWKNKDGPAWVNLDSAREYSQNWISLLEREIGLERVIPVEYYTFEKSTFDSLFAFAKKTPGIDSLQILLNFAVHTLHCNRKEVENDSTYCVPGEKESGLVDVVLELWGDSAGNPQVITTAGAQNFSQPCPNWCPDLSLSATSN